MSESDIRQVDGPARRILVVDDEPTERLLIRDCLERDGFVVDECETGKAALAAVAGQRYDLMLLDLMLPDIDGFEICRRVRRNWTSTQLPIVMLTGKEDRESVDDAIRAGSNDYITKPFSLSLLGHRLELVLDAEKVRAEKELALWQSEEANRAKSKFLTVMSHELRTPLNAIIGYSQVLNSGFFGELSDRCSQSIEVIEQSGHHLLSIVEDLLDMAKVNVGQKELDIENFRIVETLDHAIAIVAGQAEEKSVTLVLTGEGIDEDTTVNADPRAVSQIVINLLSNAVKFCHPHTTIRLVAKGDAAGNLAIECHDEGIGIAQDDIARMFEMFEQVADPLARDHGGTGIGLPYSREMARLHGGDLTIASELGKWTVATLTLPGVVVSGPAIAEPEAAAGEAEAPEASGSVAPGRVLVVEDSPTNQQYMKDVLTQFGQEVVIAEDGASALKVFAGQAFDLVFMDLQMPGMDGVETTIRMRRLESGHRTPIIALTANVMPEFREKSIEAGMDGFISKPVTIKFIQSTLAEWLPAGSGISAAADPGQAAVGLQATSADSGPAVDVTMLQDYLAASGKEKLLSLIDRFEADYRTRFERIRDALDAADLEAARADAHYIKGAFSQFGGTDAAARAHAVELAASQGDGVAARTSLEPVDACCWATFERLRSVITSGDLQDSQDAADAPAPGIVAGRGR